MNLTSKEKIKDFVVITSAASAIVMGGLSLIGIAIYIRMIIILNDSIGGLAGYSDATGKMLIAYWCCLIQCFLFFAVGVFNIFYIQRYLRDQLPKMFIGYIANFGAMVMTLLLMVGYIIECNVYSTDVSFVPVLVSATSSLLGFYFTLFVLSLAAQIASTVLMFKWEDPAACKVINITQTTPGAIMLEQAALNAKKAAPPVLNADPNAPMQPAGHNIWSMPQETPTQSVTPNPFLQPEPTAQAAAPVEPVQPVEPQPVAPVQPMEPVPMQAYDTSQMSGGSTYVEGQNTMGATSQQTTASMDPNFGVTGSTFAQPGLEPTMNPYAQSGVYVQPDNGFGQTPAAQ